MKKFILLGLLLCMTAACSASEPMYPIEQDTGFKYERQFLNEVQQEDYDNLYEACMELEDKVHLETEDEEEILAIYQAVMLDHPEMFWMDDQYDASYLDYEVTLFDTILHPKYTYTKEEVASYQQEIDAKTTELLSGISMDASDYEKVKYVYDTVIDYTDYKLLSKENQNIISVLLNQTSVCAGYARTVQYLLEKLGVDCSLQMGSDIEEGVGHAWNMVKMDGDYYYVDATYGDQVIGQNGEIDKAYDYLGMTSEEMLKLYVPDGAYEETTAIQDNYFVQTGTYFEDIDRQRISQLVATQPYLSIKCSNADVYAQMKDYLIDQEELFYILEKNGIYRDVFDYYQYEVLNSIIFIY